MLLSLKTILNCASLSLFCSPQYYRKPLHWATLNQHTEVVTVLLKAKVDINSTDIVGYVATLFHMFLLHAYIAVYQRTYSLCNC